jgi:hypothetical protein
VIGAHGIQRPRPPRAPAADIKGRDIAKISPRYIQRAAVGRYIRILRVIRGARTLADHFRKVDTDTADDGSRGDIDDHHFGAFGIRDECEFDEIVAALCQRRRPDGENDRTKPQARTKIPAHRQ